MSKDARPASSLAPSRDVIAFVPRNAGQRIGPLVLVLALMLLAAVSVGPDLAGREGTAAPATANPNAGTEFVYFPAQFLLQASEPTEHVQAF